MRHEATGEVRFVGGIWTTRVRVLGKRESFDLPTSKTRDDAIERSKLLVTWAHRFKQTEVVRAKAVEALKIIGAASDRSMKDATAAAAELLDGKIPVPEQEKAPTFKEVGEWWTTGEAHKEYPDRVDRTTPEYREENRQRLERVVYPEIGPLPIDHVTREDCDAVMAKLPEGLARQTRRQYAGLMNRILNLAELAGHIQRNPLPRGWLPRVGPRKRFPILFAEEDRALLACADVPLSRRIMYGYLHREGGRKGEARDLQRRDLDLVHRMVNLDQNKTDNARPWPLAPGVAEALEVYFDQRGDVAPESWVFIDENGGQSIDQLAKVVRDDLRRAGLDRHDLFSRGPNKGRFSTHCFRRSFVTRSLALGRNEDFVRQRTGHKSEELLTYRQQARSLAELSLSDVDPLVLAIPELSPLPGIQAALAHLCRPALDTEPLAPASLPQHCPTNSRLGDRLTAGRKILVRSDALTNQQENSGAAENTPNDDGAGQTRTEPSGSPGQSGGKESTDRETTIASLNAMQGEALRAGDTELARVLHEAIGRLLGKPGDAAPVADLAAERAKRGGKG